VARILLLQALGERFSRKSTRRTEMATVSRQPRYLAGFIFLVLASLAGTGIPRGTIPVPATGSTGDGLSPEVFSSAPPLLPHLTPDIACTESFRVGGLGYVRSSAFAGAMSSVAAGTSRYSPRTIPSSWPGIAREWMIHPRDCRLQRTIRPLSGETAASYDPDSRTAFGVLFPYRGSFRPGADRVSSLLFLSSLEYRHRQGNRAIRLVTPSLIRMGASEILAAVESRREKARSLEERMYGIAARIVLAERLGATEQYPKDLALVRAEWRYARHSSTDGTFDLTETERSIRRTEEATERLLERLHVLSD